MNKVLIASTNLHLIDSLIIKNQFNDNFHLVFIGKKNIFYENIKKEFKSYLYLEENKSKKIPLRIENSKKLLNFIKNLNPSEIIVGNDRKIETSILIKNYTNTIYSYMDDGLHSYILEKQHPFKYTFLEKILKQFIYKNKLVLPKFIGCGEYIKNAYLFKPEFANSCLKNKNLIKLEINLLKVNIDLNIPKFKMLIYWIKSFYFFFNVFEIIVIMTIFFV